MRVRDWLVNCAKDEIISFDMADFEHDCDEILRDYVEGDDPVVESDIRSRLWKSLRGWQRDKEYLSSLNLHRVVAKHVRNSCRAVSCDDLCLESWIEKDSAGLVGLADEIAIAIRAAWRVRAPLKHDTVPKFSEELSFERLDKFHFGLEKLIGYPPTNLDFLELMKQEHEQGEQFVDRDGRVVDSRVEWNIVMKGTIWTIQGAGCEPTTCIKNRDCEQNLDYYIQQASDKFANAKASGTLLEAEVAALRLWTGPMHMKYAQVLRNSQKKSGPYVTTLHAINSGIMKLARIWPLPASRKVYRGYKNLRLEDFQKDTFNCVGGVEKCVLATSVDFNIAVDYSVNDRKVGGFILEIDVGQVNRGADLSWLSQFPHEREILFNALSNVEFVSSPQQRFVEGRGTILVYKVCVSANVKGKTLEEFVRLRRDLHLNLYQEARRMISLREEGSRYTLIKNLGAECRRQCDKMLREAEDADVGIFNKRTQAYISLEEAAIMLPSRSFEIMDLALRWFKTHRATPSEVDRLQAWQLQALRTSFECSERPEVRTIVLEVDHQVESLFGARSLNFDTLDTGSRVAKLLSLNPELVSLKIGDVSATAEFWEKFAAGFGQCRPGLRVNGFRLAMYAFRSLLQLDLRSLGDDMAIMIAPALMIHPPNALTSLSLQGSPIACAGAECLGRAFTGLQRLRYIDLSSCQIASRGCTGLSQNLSWLAELEDLNLALNKVNDDGFNNLADAIRSLGLERLKSVDMRYNITSLPSLRCGSQCVMKNHFISKFSTDAAVNCVVWSPGGDQIASGSLDNTVIILDAKTGEQILTLKGHSSFVTSVAWSPGGDQIVSGSGNPYVSGVNEIIIWDAKTGDQISTLKGHTAAVTSVAWRPGGDQIASASNDTTIIVWDAKTGEQISTLKGHTRAVTSVAWRPGSPGHPGGDQIASASWDKTIIIWDAKTGKQVSTLKGHTDGVLSVAWRPERPGHPGGDQIASGSNDGTVIIWDAKTGEQISKLKGHAGTVTSVAWRPGSPGHPGDQIVSGCGDPIHGGGENEIIIWDAKTGARISTLKGHKAAVMSVAWRPGGDQIASGSADNTIIIWDAKTGEQVSTLIGHTNWVTSVAWRPERPGHPGGDQIASGSADNTVIIWDARTGEQVTTLKGHTDWVRGVAWNPDGTQIASASDDQTIIIWDTKTGDQISTLKGHTANVMSVAWRPGGDQIASGSDDNTIIIWDAKTGEQVSTLKGHTSPVYSVAWRPGGDQIASGSHDNTIIIWDAKTGEQVSTLKGHTGTVNSVSWRPGGDKVVSCAGDPFSPGELIIWDATTGNMISELKGHTKGANSVAWRPGGDQISSSSYDHTIVNWDANLDRTHYASASDDTIWVTKTGLNTADVRSVACSTGCDKIVIGSADNDIVIRDAKTGDQASPVTLKGHTGYVHSVSWNPCGNRIASGSDDKTVIIWDAKTGDKVWTLHKHTHTVMSVAWSPTDDHIVSGSSDTTLIIWDAKTGDQVSTLEGHTGEVQSVGWSAAGDRIASGSADSTIMIWDSKNGDLVSILQGPKGNVNGVWWSPSGLQLASASDDQAITIWVVSTGALDTQLECHPDAVQSVACSAMSGEPVTSEPMRDSATGDQRVRLEGNTVGAIGVCGEEQAVGIGDGCMPPPAKRLKTHSSEGTG